MPPKKFVDFICAKSRNLVHFGWKTVGNAVHNVFHTVTTGTAFPIFRPRNDPPSTDEHGIRGQYS